MIKGRKNEYEIDMINGNGRGSGYKTRQVDQGHYLLL